MKLLPMSLEHLDPVLAIERASSTRPWTEGIFRDELLDDTRVYTVAVGDRGEVLGFCGLMLVPAAGELHVQNIATDPSRRRSGVARHLLAHALEVGRERGAEAATLEVRVSNAAARALYGSFGFAPVGVRPRYYPDGEDALILWKHDL